ncbi:immunity 8 family protein [Olivibacter sp. 47]|uniref:immunity 8 family protein n=1 Tax=Olivibacter sp. 47 TaxID=3056486 RepID=UPI0025A44706|nr:immunity 8 family protein [Olivibacter sp. 47]MDM8178144.1 immunity 8 family protein [Olivibacter sp. 47]
MKAKLKYIHSPDILDLSEFIPEKQNNFSILLQLIVAPLNGEGEESFDIVLCTPQWLIENHQISDIIIGRHYLIVFEYNYSRIYNKLKELIENIDGENWDDIGMKVGRIGKWEFEDYQE